MNLGDETGRQADRQTDRQANRQTGTGKSVDAAVQPEEVGT